MFVKRTVSEITLHIDVEKRSSKRQKMATCDILSTSKRQKSATQYLPPKSKPQKSPTQDLPPKSKRQKSATQDLPPKSKGPKSAKHKGYCHHPPLPKKRELPKVFAVPLKDEDRNSWLKFKVLGENTPKPFRGLSPYTVARFIRKIPLDHPFAIIICEFAVAAFNKVCEMEVKWGVANNIHDIEFMDCEYLRLDDYYQFCIKLEAIEEGRRGVYEAKVLCTCDDGKRTLSKFFLTDRTPAGKKAMEIADSSHRIVKDDWIAAERDFYSGMRRRKDGSGYDYFTPMGKYRFSLFF